MSSLLKWWFTHVLVVQDASKKEAKDLEEKLKEEEGEKK